jgi:hypothetical protein
MSPLWIVVDVGCIECSESTELVGVYKTEDAAMKAAYAAARDRGGRTARGLAHFGANEKGFSYFSDGDHRVMVLFWEEKT